MGGGEGREKGRGSIGTWDGQEMMAGCGKEGMVFQGDYLGMLYERYVWAFSERCLEDFDRDFSTDEMRKEQITITPQIQHHPPEHMMVS
jgi:hypothetical protein